MSARRDDGFTLVELLVAVTVGMIVVIAAFTVIDRSFANHDRVVRREDALQRGRSVQEAITRQIRSQVCVQATTQVAPVVAGTDTSLTLYIYTGSPTTAAGEPTKSGDTRDVANGVLRDRASGQPFPVQRTIAYDAATNRITETTANVTSLAPSVATDTPQTRILASNVRLPSSGQSAGKLFVYYGPGTAATTAVATSPYVLTGTPVPALTTTQRDAVVQIDVAFKVLPTGSTNASDPQAATFQNSVLWRAIDPDDPTKQPCDD